MTMARLSAPWEACASDGHLAEPCPLLCASHGQVRGATTVGRGAVAEGERPFPPEAGPRSDGFQPLRPPSDDGIETCGN